MSEINTPYVAEFIAAIISMIVVVILFRKQLFKR